MAEPSGIELHAKLDAMPADEAVAALRRCCGATRWVDAMLARRPFGSTDVLLAAADEIWSTLGEADWLEAFSHHPRIGADLSELQRRFRDTARWSADEQSGAAAADESTLHDLREANLAYEARFGFTFIICATGLSAATMLAALRSRLPHDRHLELTVAAAEQAKITRLRLQKL